MTRRDSAESAAAICWLLASPHSLTDLERARSVAGGLGASPDFDGCDLVGVVSIIMGHAKL